MEEEYVVEIRSDVIQIKNVLHDDYVCVMNFNNESDLSHCVYLLKKTCDVLNIARNLIEMPFENDVFLAFNVVLDSYLEKGTNIERLKFYSGIKKVFNENNGNVENCKKYFYEVD